MKGVERKALDHDEKNEGKNFPKGSGSASSGKQKKKGKGWLRLIEAYSRHVEGLQMIQ